LKRKYAGAPNQIATDSKRIRYIENPNSGVAKAKVIEEAQKSIYSYLKSIKIL
tara:strand:- start:790 stop:948 length:159 start_codon:yes stop_codon:yes gene_type:complete